MATRQSRERRNEVLVRRFVEEIVTEQHYDRIPEFFADDYVRHDPQVPGEARGPERFEEALRTFHRGFPDETIVIDDLFGRGDRVCLRYTARATHTGEFAGLEPTGRPVELTAIAVHRVEDGRVAETWVEYDSLGLFRQLGAGPSTGE
ncbi:ester cyclase [Halomarina ordinaria]|uniref:Ester cyclase n=1 Tax=Halomarina ordinaria TaxID=3033939 RepID=A0ABD5UBD2_9EURY|nr:ester cyclase [Halomarina sp. PSRA2]